MKFNIPVVFPWVLKDVIDEVLASSDPQAGAIHVRMAFPIALYLLWTAATYFRSYPADHAAQQSCSTSEGDMNDQFVRIFGDNYGIGFGRESADAKARRAADGEST